MALEEITYLVCYFLIPILYIVGGIFKLTILTDRKKYSIVFVACVILAIIGLGTLPYVAKPNFYLFMVCPLYAFILFRLLSIWFKNTFDREPILTGKGLSANPELQKLKPGRDDLFNVAFFVLSIGGPMMILWIFG